MRRQRYNHTYSVHDDGESVEPDDQNTYDGCALQNSQEASYLNLSYDWYSSLNMQSICHPEQSSLLLSPYQYNCVWMSPVVEEFQSLSDAYCPNFWPEVNSYQYLDPYSSSALCSENVEYHQSQYHFTDDQPFEADFSTNDCPADLASCLPVVTSYGTIAMLLRHCVRVDMTADKAVYLSNFPARCVASMNSVGDKTCIIHPNGKVFQDGVTVHMETGNRVAKVSRRGITFTSLNHSLAYLVDASGTKSTAERFRSLNYDFPFGVFYKNSMTGKKSYEECLRTLSSANYRFYENGDEVWTIGGVRIKQNQWGDVRVSRNYGRRVLRASPTIGTISVTTPLIHMVAGCDPHRYFFVRKGDKRVSAHVGGFNVRNGSQKAGFDRNGKLVLH